MIKVFAQAAQDGLDWIDVVNTNKEQLQEIANQYGLHPASVADVLQPEHLPKHEIIAGANFIIIRYIDPAADKEADTIQELTNKIAIYYTDALVITIHQSEITFIDELKKELIDAHQVRNIPHLLNRIVKSVLLSYDEPARKLADEIDFYESQVFLENKIPRILKGIYHLRRKIDVTKRLLMLSRDILENVDDPEHQNPNTRDTRDLFVRLETLYDSMSENTNQLLNIYFSISSQRVNEVIRILTIFSVFFMPLTFIAGIYGMNFEFMPELHWKWGYPAAMALMLLITISIYFWFRRKGWL